MSAEVEVPHYLEMQQSDARKDFRQVFKPKHTVDAFWTSDYSFLKEIVSICKPDMIVADFFVDAAKDVQYQTGIPIAMVWPQMPYGMVGASYIPGIPGFQIDALTSENASILIRIRAALRPLRALPAIVRYLKFVRGMRRNAGINYNLPIFNKPNYLVLVNSFWGLETPKDLPPLVAAVGPILSEEYPQLDATFEDFYKSHKRVLYVAFGTHIQVLPNNLEKFLTAFGKILNEGLVDGIIWAINNQQRGLFDSKAKVAETNSLVGNLLENQDPSWLFTPFAPQRAILARPETVLFVTHGGGSSVNEALFHGTPMLTLGFFFDQLMNALRLTEAGVALALDKANFSTEEILAKITALLTDKDGSIAQNVARMQHIARISARKKELGADLIEEVLYDHRFSLVPHGATAWESNSRSRPMHLQTADARMSAWRAKNMDLTFLGIFGGASIAALIYFAFTRPLHIGTLLPKVVAEITGWLRANLSKFRASM